MAEELRAESSRRLQEGEKEQVRKDRGPDVVGFYDERALAGLLVGAVVTGVVLGIQTANELGEVMASLGLAQNLAAMRALATEGIQRGHMSLHARAVAATAGAEGDEVILFEPFYDSYPACCAMNGAIPRYCVLRFPDFAFDGEQTVGP